MPLPGDHLERRICAQSSGGLARSALHAWIHAVRELLLDFIASLPRLSKRDSGVHAKRERFLLFRKTVGHPPIATAIRIHQQEQPATIAERGIEWLGDLDSNQD